MPKIKYEEEYKFKGVVFKKWEIFYADRGWSERSWRGYYWRRLGIVIFLLLWGVIPWLIPLYLLFWRTKPRNRRLFVNKDYIWRKGWFRFIFTGRKTSALIKKDKIVEIKIFQNEGEVRIFKQGLMTQKSYVGRILNIGKIEELILLLKNNNYPFMIIEK